MDAVEAIIQLKKERRAVILAHNYQPPEIQDIADYVGDSPGLSIQAARTDAEALTKAIEDYRPRKRDAGKEG